MTRMQDKMPVLYRHKGRWTGTYTNIDPTGAILDTYTVDCLCEFPEDGEFDFLLSTRNVWADGRETTGQYGSAYRDGKMVWSGVQVGWMQEIDDLTLYLRFGSKEDPSVTVCEMIQISHDGQNRCRTWHWLRDQVLFQTTLTHEHRVE